MVDKDGSKVTKNYRAEVSFVSQGGFYVKGSNGLDWGMKKHLGNIFDSKSGNAVMFVFDHGHFMSSTTDLERSDLLTPRLLPYVNVLMGTRGALCMCVPPEYRKATVLRAISGSSIFNDDLSHEVIAVGIEDCIYMNADCTTIQTLVGADGQLPDSDNLSRTVNAGLRCGIPTIGVVTIGKQMEWTDRLFKLATHLLAELEANIIKTCYCESFEEIISAYLTPIAIAGGKKLPEDKALTLAYRSISEGARDLDMGHDIFQSENSAAMAGAISKIVHHGFTDKQAFEFYQNTIHQ